MDFELLVSSFLSCCPGAISTAEGLSYDWWLGSFPWSPVSPFKGWNVGADCGFIQTPLVLVHFERVHYISESLFRAGRVPGDGAASLCQMSGARGSRGGWRGKGSEGKGDNLKLNLQTEQWGGHYWCFVRQGLVSRLLGLVKPPGYISQQRDWIWRDIKLLSETFSVC